MRNPTSVVVLSNLAAAAVALVLLASATVPVSSSTTEDSPHDTDVYRLTTENYSSMLSKGKWLVKFYAPWCGHCKALAPVWEEAAAAVKGKVHFGKMDCTAESGPCDRFGVRGYPSLKYFDEGLGRDFVGGRAKEDLVHFANKVTGPLVQAVSSETFTKFVSSPDVSVLYFPDGSFSNDEAMIETAKEFIDDCLFGSTTDAKLMTKFGISELPAIVVYHGEDDWSKYTGSLHPEKMHKWLKRARYPLLGELTAERSRVYKETEFMTLVACVDSFPSKKSVKEAFLSEVRSVAKAYASSNVVFCFVDGRRWAQFISQFGVDAEALPGFFLWDPSHGYHYHDAGLAVTASGVTALIDGALKGTYKPLGYGVGPVADVMKFFAGVWGAIKSAAVESPIIFGVTVAVFIAMFVGVCCFGDAGDDVVPEKSDKKALDPDNSSSSSSSSSSASRRAVGKGSKVE